MDKLQEIFCSNTYTPISIDLKILQNILCYPQTYRERQKQLRNNEISCPFLIIDLKSEPPFLMVRKRNGKQKQKMQYFFSNIFFYSETNKTMKILVCPETYLFKYSWINAKCKKVMNCSHSSNDLTSYSLLSSYHCLENWVPGKEKDWPLLLFVRHYCWP